MLSTLSDDNYASISLGIDFTFFGVNYPASHTIHVSSNGLVSFGLTNSDLSNNALPYSGNDYPMAAVYWDDLDAGDGGGVYWEVQGTNMIIQYNIPPHEYPAISDTYDARIVFEGSTGIVHYCYLDTTAGVSGQDLGISATSGIQGSGSTGLTYSHDTANLTAGQHVWFVGP